MHSLISIKDDFFERRSQKRPVYTLKLDQEGKIVRDKNGILVVLVNSYVQGELKTTKQLLYREAVDGVLSSLHYIKGVLGEDTCLLGGVNALSRLFNQKYVFKGIFNQGLLGSMFNMSDEQPLANVSASPSFPHWIFLPPFSFIFLFQFGVTSVEGLATYVPNARRDAAWLCPTKKSKRQIKQKK